MLDNAIANSAKTGFKTPATANGIAIVL